jgi:hypothetical protein
MKRWLGSLIATSLFVAASSALADFHLFRIDQLYSNADGTVQFVVITEAFGFNGENLWNGHTLTSAHGGDTATLVFNKNLPSSTTAGRHVLVATQGFAALGLVTPDYVVANGFLHVDGGTLNYAGVDQVTYASLPTNGAMAIDRTGAPVQNKATNFAGQSAAVTVAATSFSPVPGVWYDPAQSGNGYGMDYRNGVLIVQVYSFLANGTAQWYLAAGQINANVFHGTLDRYLNGQCASGPACVTYRDPGTPVGNDGELVITFTSERSANVVFPGGRTSTIRPFFPP